MLSATAPDPRTRRTRRRSWRRGATLVELLVALAVGAVVVAAVVRSRAGSHRAATDAIARAEARRQLRAGGGAVLATLRGAAPGADLVAMADSVLELRVTLGATALCAAAPTSVDLPPSATLLLPRPGGVFTWHDAPGAGDELLVLVDEALAPTPAVDSSGGVAIDPARDTTRWRWVALRVAGAGMPVRLPCMGGADEPALRVPLAAAPPAGVRPGSVTFVARRGRWSVYASRGRWFLGWRDVAASGAGLDVVQPVSGPHDVREGRGPWRAGVAFSFVDAMGAPSADAARVAVIAMRAVATTVAPDAVDSLTVLAALRNGGVGAPP